MNIQLRYLLFEIRRAFCRFGRMILVTLLLAAVCAGLGTAAFYRSEPDSQTSPFTVAVSIPPDAGLHYSLALGMVTQMDSFQSMCTVIRTDSEEEARAMLDSGEAKAAVIIPEGMIHSILNGTNIPARIIYPAEPSLETVLFRNLVDSLSHMLGTSQAGVYALYDIYSDYGADEHTQNTANSALNSSYIDMVLNRAPLFSQESLSFDRETPSYLPFLSGGLALLLLLTGICLCEYLCPRSRTLSQALGRLRIGSLAGCIGPVAGAWTVQFCLYAVLSLPVILLRPIPGILTGSGLLFLPVLAVCCFFAAAFQFAVCRLCRIREAGMILLFFLSLVLVFLGGGLLPMAFLPDICRRLAAVNPAVSLQKALSAGLMGQADAGALTSLLVWGAVFTVLPCAAVPAASWLSGHSGAFGRFLSDAKRRIRLPKTGRRHAPADAAKTHEETAAAGTLVRRRMRAWLLLLTKRTLRRPVYWLLTLAVIIAGLAALLSDSNASAIPVALYCENPDSFTAQILDELLTSDKSRLYRFYRADSKDSLTEDVLWGKAECGYLIPDSLLPILNQEEEGTILACTSSATVLDLMIREELYAAVFDSYAPFVLADYIREAGHIEIKEEELAREVSRYFPQWMESGSTFRVEYEDVEADFFTNDAAFAIPLRGLLSLLLLAAVMAGMSQYRHDRNKQLILIRYPGEKWYLPCFYSLLPALLPAVSGILCLYLGGQGEGLAAELGAMILYLVLLMLFALLLHITIRSMIIFDAVIPLLVIFCILYAPVITDLSSYLPGSDILAWLAPASWYLRLF